MTIQHRLLIPLMLRGNIGKSVLLSLVAQWLAQREILWAGVDWDNDHQSFSRLFPDEVRLAPLGEEPEGDILKLLRICPNNPLFLADPRAHLSDVIIRSWKIVQFPEAFARDGGRITIFLFPGEDLEVLTDIDRTVGLLGNLVDYIVVKNRARAPRTRMYDGSALESDLLSLGAEVLEIPVLLSMARNHLAALEAELGRGVTHVEAIANKQLPLDPMVRLIIEDWVKGIFRRLDALAPQLLPSALIANIPKQETPYRTLQPIRRGSKINRDNL